jgi:catechol 2,3-dioxygenase-like lactoylglutathione lyase family enzyme
MSFGPILAATVATGDLDHAIRCYTAGLGLSVIDGGEVSAALAAAWGAGDLAGARWAGLAGGGDEIGGLRLVETGGPAVDALPLASLGWAAAELSVAGVDHRVRVMTEAGFRVLGAPRPLGSNPDIRAAQLAGPDGEALYITDVSAHDGAVALRRATRPVDRCFIAVLASADLEAARGCYEGTFGTRRVSDRQVGIPVLTARLGLAPGETVRISSQQLAGDCLIEIDAYPPATPPRPMRRGLAAGVAMMTFAGPANGPPGPAAWPYRGRPTEMRRGGAGELIELVGAAA